MPFINSNNTTILHGALPLAAYLRSVTPSANVDMLDVTSLADTSKSYIAGLEEFTLNIDGMFDNATGAGTLWDTITGQLGGSTPVATSIAPTGFASGNSVWLIPALTANYEPSSAVADVVNFSASFNAGQSANIGVSLLDLAALTATGNGSSVDNSAATSNGYVAHLHVTAVSGTTPSMTMLIQHSTNNSTWSTLATFTAATAATSQVVTGSGTVNRYIRASYTITGTTPSFTTQISLARL